MKTKTLKEIEKEANEFNDKANVIRKGVAKSMIIGVFFYLVVAPSNLIQHVSFGFFILPTYLSALETPKNNKKRYMLQTVSFLACIYIYNYHV